MWRNLSCGNISPPDRFLHISPHTTFRSTFVMWRTVIDFLHISRLEKLLHMKICHMEKFLHMTDFCPQALLVVLVTNIRYGEKINFHSICHQNDLLAGLLTACRLLCISPPLPWTCPRISQVITCHSSYVALDISNQITKNLP